MTIPKIYILQLGSLLPPEHPGWDDPDIANKTFTPEGSEQAIKLLQVSPDGVTRAEQFHSMSREQQTKAQIRAMDLEMSIFQEAYTDMSFVQVKPSILPDGTIQFPRKKDFLAAWQQVTQDSLHKRYFGVYYSGISEVGTGNWVVLPDDDDKAASSVELITLTQLLRMTQVLGYQSGYIWMSLDCPFGGNWVLQVYKEHHLYEDCFSNILVDSAADQFNVPDWLTYIVRLRDRFQSLWTRSTPIAFNKNFPTVVWPDKKNQPIPYPNKCFEWVDHQSHRQIDVDALED